MKSRLPKRPPRTRHNTCVDCGAPISPKAKRCRPHGIMARDAKLPPRCAPADPFEDCPELLAAFLPHPPAGGMLW